MNRLLLKKEDVKFRRSLYAINDIAKGEPSSHSNVKSIRLGFGLSPKELNRVPKCKAKVSIPKGTPINDDLILPSN